MLGLAWDAHACVTATIAGGQPQTASPRRIDVDPRQSEQVAECLAQCIREVGSPPGQVVVTVPAWASDQDREVLRSALGAAGCERVALINEPAALALAQWFTDGQEHAELAVCSITSDLIDVTALRVSETMVEVLWADGQECERLDALSAAEVLTALLPQVQRAAEISASSQVILTSDQGDAAAVASELEQQLDQAPIIVADRVTAMARGAALFATIAAGQPSRQPVDKEPAGGGGSGCLILLGALLTGAICVLGLGTLPLFS